MNARARGIRVSGGRKFGDLDMSSMGNQVKDNKLQGLVVKSPDNYSDNHIDGKMFSGFGGRSKMALYWLDKYTKRNALHLRKNESYIDKGKENNIVIS